MLVAYCTDNFPLQWHEAPSRVRTVEWCNLNEEIPRCWTEKCGNVDLALLELLPSAQVCDLTVPLWGMLGEPFLCYGHLQE